MAAIAGTAHVLTARSETRCAPQLERPQTMNDRAVSLSHVLSPEGLGATLTAAGLTAASLQADWPTTTWGWVAFVLTLVVAVGKAITK